LDWSSSEADSLIELVAASFGGRVDILEALKLCRLSSSVEARVGEVSNMETDKRREGDGLDERRLFVGADLGGDRSKKFIPS
jgi:hypothetical protein